MALVSVTAGGQVPICFLDLHSGTYTLSHLKPVPLFLSLSLEPSLQGSRDCITGGGFFLDLHSGTCTLSHESYT